METHVLMGGTRRAGGVVILDRDLVEDEMRNCWTSYIIMRGSLDECRRVLIEEYPEEE